MLISETHANTLRRNAIPSQIDAETDIGQLIRRGEINFIHPHKIIWYRSRYCREREREGSHREGGGEITGKHVTDTSKKEVTLFIKSFQKRSSLSCKENGANPSSSAFQASLIRLVRNQTFAAAMGSQLMHQRVQGRNDDKLTHTHTHTHTTT